MSKNRRTKHSSFTLYQQPKSQNWWVDLHIGGKRFRRSTGERTRRAAEAKARLIYDELVAEQALPPRREGDDLALLAALDIQEAQARGVGNRQLTSIKGCWDHLCRVLGPETSPDNISYDRVVAFIAARRGEGARGQSIVKESQALKRGLRIAMRRGSVRQLLNEWPRIRRDPPCPKKKGKLHPTSSLLAWISYLRKHFPEAGWQASTALRTGLRAEELRKVRWSWVEDAPPDSGVPKLLRVPAWATKNRRERVIGLTAEVVQDLEAVRSARDLTDDEPLMPGLHRKVFATASEAIGYGKVITLRDLRHCHATWAAQGTGDAAAAQAALGHTDLRTTQRYLSSTLARTASAAVAVRDQLESSGARPAKNRHTRPSYHANSTQEDEDPEGREASPGQQSEGVGVRGFEPPAFCSRSRRATRLRYTPKFGRTGQRSPAPPPSPAALWHRHGRVKAILNRPPHPESLRWPRPGPADRTRPNHSPARRPLHP